MTDKEIKTSYAKFLLPKLEYATSDKCKNIKYVQKRLRDAITCIEDLIGTIHSLPIEEPNNNSKHIKEAKIIEPHKEILAYFTMPKDKVIEEEQNVCFHISPKGNLLISSLNNDGHYESIDVLSVKDFIDGMTMQNAEYFLRLFKEKVETGRNT